MVETKDFCSYDASFMLKEVGYCEPAFAYYCVSNNSESRILYYNTNEFRGGYFIDCRYCYNQFNKENCGYLADRYVDVPLLYEAIKWLWEKHDIEISQSYVNAMKGHSFMICGKDCILYDSDENGEYFSTPEEALNAGVLKTKEFLTKNN